MVADNIAGNNAGQRDRSTRQKVIETLALVMSWIVMVRFILFFYSIFQDT